MCVAYLKLGWQPDTVPTDTFAYEIPYASMGYTSTELIFFVKGLCKFLVEVQYRAVEANLI